jgi:hypothetical protein
MIGGVILHHASGIIKPIRTTRNVFNETYPDAAGGNSRHASVIPGCGPFCVAF